MDIRIAKDSPFGIKEQIKRQLRLLISSGQLPLGQILPSARDLAVLLHVNRNTVSAAYKELSTEGVLELKIGSGTYVKGGPMNETAAALEQIFNETLALARQRGVGPEALAEHFLTRFAAFPVIFKECLVLVVDCNQETVAHISATLQGELGVRTEGVLIQELEAGTGDPSRYLKDKDLVVCGFNHLEEFNRAVPAGGREVVAVILNPDLRLMREVATIPAGSTVGYCCANQRSTETLFRRDIFSSGTEVKRILVGADRPEELKKMLGQCDLVFATGYAVERVREWIRPEARLVRVDLTIAPGNVKLIREKLIEVKLRQGVA